GGGGRVGQLGRELVEDRGLGRVAHLSRPVLAGVGDTGGVGGLAGEVAGVGGEHHDTASASETYRAIVAVSRTSLAVKCQRIRFARRSRAAGSVGNWTGVAG